MEVLDGADNKELLLVVLVTLGIGVVEAELTVLKSLPT